MKKAITLLLQFTLTLSLLSQGGFENFNLAPDEFLNGSDGSGGFETDGYFLPNQFTDAGGYTYWSGWAISSMTDTTTPGFLNEYSCIAGSGADNSTTYATSFVLGESVVRTPFINDPWTFVSSIDVNNSTYAYLSMLEGDNYAKKFGGLNGDDPDFFLLTIKGYLNDTLVNDSIDFYLADFRFDDNYMDYIVNEWTTIDLMSLGQVDSLSFTLSSSDVGAFGMNTPAYFCLDNLVTGYIFGANEKLINADFSIFPNPATQYLSIDWKEFLNAKAFIFSATGQLVLQSPLAYGLQTIDVNALPPGLYFLKIQTDEGWVSQRFVKN